MSTSPAHFRSDSWGRAFSLEDDLTDIDEVAAREGLVIRDLAPRSGLALPLCLLPCCELLGPVRGELAHRHRDVVRRQRAVGKVVLRSSFDLLHRPRVRTCIIETTDVFLL